MLQAAALVDQAAIIKAEREGEEAVGAEIAAVEANIEEVKKASNASLTSAVYPMPCQSNITCTYNPLLNVGTDPAATTHLPMQAVAHQSNHLLWQSCHSLPPPPRTNIGCNSRCKSCQRARDGGCRRKSGGCCDSRSPGNQCFIGGWCW